MRDAAALRQGMCWPHGPFAGAPGWLRGGGRTLRGCLRHSPPAPGARGLAPVPFGDAYGIMRSWREALTPKPTAFPGELAGSACQPPRSGSSAPAARQLPGECRMQKAKGNMPGSWRRHDGHHQHLRARHAAKALRASFASGVRGKAAVGFGGSGGEATQVGGSGGRRKKWREALAPPQGGLPRQAAAPRRAPRARPSLKER
jgi:hypothetical protein